MSCMGSGLDASPELTSQLMLTANAQASPLLSQAEVEAILAHGAACLDPELRRPDAFTRSYPRTIPMINERFGPDAAHKGV